MDLRQKDFFAEPAAPAPAPAPAAPATPPAEESAKRSLRVITRSSLAAFRTCARLYQYSYLKRYRSLHVAPALATGTLGHLGLEAWWRAAQRGASEEERLDAALAAIAHEQDPYERARMSVLLAGYSARWGAEQWEVLDVEVSFEAEIIHPATGAASRTWVQGGKIDVVVRDPADGLIWIVEHKFTGEDFSVGSNYWRRLKTDQQISIYYQGAAALFGHLGEIGGCLYDVIGKPTTRPLKATPAESRKYTKAGALYANQREADETPEEYAARLTELVAATPTEFFCARPGRAPGRRARRCAVGHLADVARAARGRARGPLAAQSRRVRALRPELRVPAGVLSRGVPRRSHAFPARERHPRGACSREPHSERAGGLKWQSHRARRPLRTHPRRQRRHRLPRARRRSAVWCARPPRHQRGPLRRGG